VSFAKHLAGFVCVVAAFSLAHAQSREYRTSEPRYGVCFYKDADFRGDRFCLQDGDRMERVPEEFNDRISSVRIYGQVEITVYQGANFGGPSLRLRESAANLQSYQVRPGHSWNDRITSIEVGTDRRNWERDGDWDRNRNNDRDHDLNRDRVRDWQNRDPQEGACFYKEANFNGDRFCVQRGDRLEQVPAGFNDKISSVRLYGRVEIIVYQDRNFGGRKMRLREDVPNLQGYQVEPGHSWNDRISSIKAH
jgi:peptidase inhibitor family I36